MKVIPSPNFNDRPAGTVVDILVVHYTGMKGLSRALTRLCDPQSEVSSHYLIDETGEVISLVPEEKRAWHAGKSGWRGRENINDTSVGVELVNPGHEFGYQPFPEAQMEAFVNLAKGILLRHAIPARNVVGHSDIAPIRKEDPGELFDWKRLAEEGIGIWPEVGKECFEAPKPLLKKGFQGEPVVQLQKSLVEYGYFLKIDGDFGVQTEAAVKAFQRHFLPREKITGQVPYAAGVKGSPEITGVWDTGLEAILKQLQQMVE